MMYPRFFLLFFLLFNTACFAAPIYPKLTGQIVDRAQMLDTQQKNSLLQHLKKLEEKSSDQLVIVTLPSLQGYDIAEFSLELARHWKIGQKDTNNGVLLVIAPKERKMRIEVGYGLEGTLTDILAHKIITNRIKPAFKKGQMFEGIKAGTIDIIDILLGNAEEVKQRLKSKKPQKNNNSSLLVMLFWGAIFFFPSLSSFFAAGSRNKRGGGVHIIAAAQKSHSNWQSGGYSGGWSSGGGGFSGGGGSFGGGGSSGSW